MGLINRPMYLVDLVTLEELQIMAVPPELSHNNESNFSVVASPGRNNQFSHFSGSDDILEFELDWYYLEQGRLDVMMKCRWVESLSKADGYEDGPHLIKLIFGDIYPPELTWQVVSAPFKFTMFDGSQQMRPVQAYQTIRLRKQVDFNRRYIHIRNGY